MLCCYKKSSSFNLYSANIDRITLIQHVKFEEQGATVIVVEKVSRLDREYSIKNQWEIKYLHES